MRRRHNPPKDIDSLNVLGGECSVWAIAAATGTSVPDVRRAFMKVGADIWGPRGGGATGASMAQVRSVIRELDWDKRIISVGVGADYFMSGGPKGQFTQKQTDLFLRGKLREQYSTPDAFDVPEGVRSRLIPGAGPESAVEGVGFRCVGQLVRYAKEQGLALLAVTANARRYRGAHHVSAHIIGYSPAKGVYDTAVRVPLTPELRTKYANKTATGFDWYAHGQNVPESLRPAMLWIYFKGE